MKHLNFLLLLLLTLLLVSCNGKQPHQQSSNYKIYFNEYASETWELDTSTGQLWLIWSPHYGESVKKAIVDKPLIGNTEKKTKERFELHFNRGGGDVTFLFDKKTGEIWAYEWNDKGEREFIPLD